MTQQECERLTMSHPPKPELALTLGITGHRAIDAANRAALIDRLDSLFAHIAAKVVAIGEAHPGLFDGGGPSLTLVSALAEGADQLAAESALRHGFSLHAILPFPRTVYAEDFSEDALNEFNALMERAAEVCELPVARGSGPRGYVLAGQATVAQCDILIAAWDGEDGRGRGGTADVVDLALRRITPVIHLPTGSSEEPTIMWSRYDEVAPEYLQPDDAPHRPLNSDTLDALIERVIAPPASPELKTFLKEREHRNRWRLEWAFMLAALRIQPLGKASFRVSNYDAAAREDWANYLEGAEEVCGPLVRMERLEAAFAWADGLAQHYANVFRSGVVLNFAGAALAVVLSLFSGPFPEYKIWLLIAELIVLLAVILNTAYGTREQWHRRWLDYRFLAEQLRPLRSLKLLGAGSISIHARSNVGRWTDWYAQSIWRTLGAPASLASTEAHNRLARHIAAHELEGQVTYNQNAAHRMHLLDHRFHRIGVMLFASTILIGLGTLAGLVFAYEKVKYLAPFLGMLSAALPTMGAAIFGIRAAADFAGTAGRSAETARRLAHISELLRRDNIDHGTAARAAEEAAAIMLADLGEWRSAYAHKKLAIPS
jgi:hypothetical protein